MKLEASDSGYMFSTGFTFRKHLQPEKIGVYFISGIGGGGGGGGGRNKAWERETMFSQLAKSDTLGSGFKKGRKIFRSN